MIENKSSVRFAWVLGFAAFAAILIGCGGGGSVTTTGADSGANSGADAGANAGANSGANSGANAGGNAGAGSLPANSIYFATGSVGDYQLRTVKPDGTASALVGTFGAGFAGFAPNASVAGELFFGFQTGANFGIYKNSTVSMTGATEVVAPAYSDVLSMQVSPDGTKLGFVATNSLGDTKLYIVPTTGGVPVALDDADSMAFSPDGSKILYSNFVVAGNSELFTIPVGGGTRTRLTNNTVDDFAPQYSRSGAKIVFSRLNALGRATLGTMNSNGTSQVLLSNPADLDMRGGSFNDDGTMVSFVGLGSSLAEAGVYRANVDGTGVVLLQQSDVILSDAGTYWTSQLGRSRSVTDGFKIGFPRR